MIKPFAMRNLEPNMRKKKRWRMFFVTSEVSERSPDNTKHGQLNQPVNSTSVNFEQVLVACGERVLLQTASVPIQRADGSEKIFAKVLLDSAIHRTFMTD